MGKIDEIKLSIESEDFAQRRTGRKGTSYYNGLAAGYREGYRKRASEGKESPDELGDCNMPRVIKSEAAVCPKCKSTNCLFTLNPFYFKCFKCGVEWQTVL